MRAMILSLFATLAGCADTACARQYASVEPAHECLALNCTDADTVEEWTEEIVDEETGGTTKVNHAVCTWDCVEMGNGSRARITQEYQRTQGPDECIELTFEDIDRARADCDRECEQPG